MNMNIKKFSASTSREAMRKVKEALGNDAVILSNRNIDGRVEITAMVDDTPVEQAFASPVNSRMSERNSAQSAPVEYGDGRIEPQLRDVPRSSRPSIHAPEPVPAVAQFAPRPSRESAALSPHELANFGDVHGKEMASVMDEIRGMRAMLEAQLAELSWTNTQKRQPKKADILREMLASGFSASLSRYLIDKMPESEVEANGMAWIKSILARNMSAIDNEHEILEKGGVYALVGPTGVGKTTTTAKLAARCVMRHGPGKLALITTDAYRIGGYEQLRIYGKILGVMVHSVKDESDLRIALAELKNKHTVLIDTVGVSQRDKMVSEQVNMLSGPNSEVKRLLCLNATCTGETLSEVVRAYQGSGLAGCILTKLDEAATIGGALDIAIRQKLQLYYVASGQRVPEDLHVANKQYLIDRAFKLKRETAAFRLNDDELPMMLAGAAMAHQANNANNANRGFKEKELAHG
jgi:flagellar biosynthesis protein FlhF